MLPPLRRSRRAYSAHLPERRDGMRRRKAASVGEAVGRQAAAEWEVRGKSPPAGFGGRAPTGARGPAPGRAAQPTSRESKHRRAYGRTAAQRRAAGSLGLPKRTPNRLCGPGYAPAGPVRSRGCGRGSTAAIPTQGCAASARNAAQKTAQAGGRVRRPGGWAGQTLHPEPCRDDVHCCIGRTGDDPLCGEFRHR